MGETLKLYGHGNQKYITGTMHNSSSARNWSSILVERWEHHGGKLHPLSPSETEIAIQLSGHSRVRRRGDGKLQDNHSMPGTVWLCPAGIYEKSVNIFGPIEECLHIYIPAKLFSRSALEDFDIDPANIELCYEGGFRDKLIEQIGRAMSTEMQAPTVTGGLLIESLRTALAGYLLQNFSNVASGSHKLRYADCALDARRMQRVEDLIEGNLDRTITLAELADSACFSRFHFARMFKKTTGKTPHQYIVERKIMRARQMLEQSSTSLGTIADRTGFSSQAHFSRSFAKAVGVPPGKYRRSFH